MANNLLRISLPCWNHDQSAEDCCCKEQFAYTRHDLLRLDISNGQSISILMRYSKLKLHTLIMQINLHNWFQTQQSCFCSEWTTRKNSCSLHSLVELFIAFYILQNREDRLWGSLSLLFNGHLPSFTGIKRQDLWERLTAQLLLSRMLRNIWILNLILQRTYMAWRGENFTILIASENNLTSINYDVTFLKYFLFYAL
jgi:hypothetical protein